MAVLLELPEDPKTWFYLVSGGGEKPEEELSARTELKKILRTILEQKLAEKDHIVFASARSGKLDPAIYCAQGVGQTVHTFDEIFVPMPGFQNMYCQKFPSSVDAKKCDNAVVIFIGHGNNPKDWYFMPPSASPSDKELGNFIFFKNDGEKIIASPQKILKNTLFISVACYSGNTFQQKFDPQGHLLAACTFQQEFGPQGEQKFGPQGDLLAVCTADPDHPASFDPILGDTFAKFFSDGLWKQKTVTHFCDKLQESYLSHPYILKMKEENLQQTEEDYETERKQSAEWAGKDYIEYVPCQIPRDLWEMFREVEQLKKTVQVEDISVATKKLLMEHIATLEHKRFDLMRMYKHKPNNKLFIWGAKDSIGKMSWREFLHLPPDVEVHSPKKWAENVQH